MAALITAAAFVLLGGSAGIFFVCPMMMLLATMMAYVALVIKPIKEQVHFDKNKIQNFKNEVEAMEKGNMLGATDELNKQFKEGADTLKSILQSKEAKNVESGIDQLERVKAPLVTLRDTQQRVGEQCRFFTATTSELELMPINVPPSEVASKK